jgi:hypothetical protein
MEVDVAFGPLVPERKRAENLVDLYSKVAPERKHVLQEVKFMRVLGVVAGEEKSDEVLGKLREKYPDTKFEKSPSQSVGSYAIEMHTDTAKVTEPEVEQMTRLVQEFR